MTNGTQLSGHAKGWPRVILQLEGLAIFLLAVLSYYNGAGGWKMFAALFLLPDVFMFGFLINPRIGAVIYNLGHNYILPIALLAFAWQRDLTLAMSVSLIWIAHLGFDRAVGYGLKYGSGFKHTHLSWK